MNLYAYKNTKGLIACCADCGVSFPRGEWLPEASISDSLYKSLMLQDPGQHSDIGGIRTRGIDLNWATGCVCCGNSFITVTPCDDNDDNDWDKE